MSAKKKPTLPGQKAVNMQVRARDLDRLEKAIATETIGTIDRAKCRTLHEQMIKGKLPTLTSEQRQWLAGVLETQERGPKYENLISSGKAPIGADVVVNVGRLPLTPPGRGVRITYKDGLP